MQEQVLRTEKQNLELLTWNSTELQASGLWLKTIHIACLISFLSYLTQSNKEKKWSASITLLRVKENKAAWSKE